MGLCLLILRSQSHLGFFDVIFVKMFALGIVIQSLIMKIVLMLEFGKIGMRMTGKKLLRKPLDVFLRKVRLNEPVFKG